MINYNKLIEYGLKQHDEVVEHERIALPLLYFGSILASMADVRMYSQVEKRLEMVNFYGMSFLPSGAGKDYALKIYQKLFKDILDRKHLIVRDLATACLPNGDRATSFPVGLDKKIHRDYRVSIGSSDIGLYIQALAIESTRWGSLNVEINEFADYLGKSENINMLKELYDGELKAKLIQGDKDDEARQSLENVWCNMMAYGTPTPIKEDKQKLKLFKDLTSSGMFRRSLVYFTDAKRATRQDREEIDVSDVVTKLLNTIKKTIVVDEKKVKFVKAGQPIAFTFSSDAQIAIENIKDELFNAGNERIYDERASFDKFSGKVVEKIATIVAFLDGSDCVVEVGHVDYAYSLFKSTRLTVAELFDEVHPFEKIYKLLYMATEPLDQTFIMKRLALNKREFEDSIPLLKQHAYLQNRIVEEYDRVIKKYEVKLLPTTDLSKIKVSIGLDKRREQSINFRATEIPFFGEQFSVEALVKSDEFDCFCTCHFEPSNKAESGHRAEQYFIEGQNLIAFDFDTGISMEEAMSKFLGLTFILYTTKSHQQEGKGDRFRVLIPTMTEFFVTPEQHKQMYENVANAFEVTAYDRATRNVSRLWFTNPDAEIITQQGQLLDITKFLPETTSNSKFSNAIKKATEGESDVKIQGFMKWFFATTGNGNRNDHLFRFKKYLDDMGVKAEPLVTKCNAMLDEPLPDKELRVILRSK